MRLICEHSAIHKREIDSSDISCDERFETECGIAGSSCDNEDFSCGYLGEPEYTEQQAKSMKFSASSSSSDDDELNSSRLENLHWCTCHHCTVMPTFIECKCCEEFPNLLKDKLDDACITDHKDFDVLCRHNSVLKTTFIRHRRYKSNYTDAKEMILNCAVVN